ncbi:MAG: hypothetical protein ACRDMV_01265, partial [Streptosporangiales bacterium]
IVTKRICIGLQRKDLNLLHEGVETGVIRRTPQGGYAETTREVAPEHRAMLEYRPPNAPEPVRELADAHGVEPKGNGLARLRSATQRWYTRDNVMYDRENGHANGHGTDEEQSDEAEPSEVTRGHN